MQQRKFKNNSNLVSLSILIAGALIFLVVVYFAYQKISSSPQQEGELQKKEISFFKESKVINRAAGESVKRPDKKTYKRQKSITDKEMAGLWKTKLKSGRALLEMEAGVYRLVIIPENKARVRYYSNGYYKITNDLVVLHPNTKWGAPQEGTYDYRVLTSADLPIIAAKYKGKLIWQMPPKDVKIYIPPNHAVLDLSEDKVLIWRAFK